MNNLTNNNPQTKNIICFTGPPGSGKGTHSYRCLQKYKNTLELRRFSVGDEVRLLNADKPHGMLADKNVVESVINKNLAKSNKNFIIDGYPRSTEQMEMLIERKKSGIIANLAIFNLYMSDVEILFDRLHKRNNCAKCGYTDASSDICPKCDLVMSKRRDDLELTAMKNRIRIYYEFYDKIRSIADENQVPVYNFDASEDIEKTFSSIESKLLEYFKA